MESDANSYADLRLRVRAGSAFENRVRYTEVAEPHALQADRGRSIVNRFLLARVSAADANRYVTAIADVCGRVVDGRRGSGDTPTLLNLDRPFPNQPFTVVIWENDVSRFGGSPLDRYRNQNRCFFGEIGAFRGSPQMTVSGPDQVTPQSE